MYWHISTPAIRVRDERRERISLRSQEKKVPKVGILIPIPPEEPTKTHKWARSPCRRPSSGPCCSPHAERNGHLAFDHFAGQASFGAGIDAALPAALAD